MIVLTLSSCHLVIISNGANPMSIEFKPPEAIEKQLQPVRTVAENIMRPESRPLDDHEHERPVKFVHMMWPQMQQIERANLEAALTRARKSTNGDSQRTPGNGDKPSAD